MKRILFLLTLCGLFSLGVSAKSKLKTAYRNLLIYAYAESSIEDDNIKLEIINGSLYATNKTKKTIFLDLSQCFIGINGNSSPMYDENQGKSKKSKKGITTSTDVFLTIAPSLGDKQDATFIRSLTPFVWGNYTTTETPLSTDFFGNVKGGELTKADKNLFNVLNDLVEKAKAADPKKKQYIGTASCHLTEDESIQTISVSIAYAFNKRTEDWTNCQLSTWVSDVILAPYYVEMPEDVKNKKGFGVKEQKPAIIHIKAEWPFEKDNQKPTGLFSDWEGNYKKGTFTLVCPSPSKADKSFSSYLKGTLRNALTGTNAPLDRKYYESVYQFDGENSDWGEMNFVDDINKTMQAK